MPISEARLNQIFDKTDGRCHLCHKKLAFKNYSSIGSRGAWEVEHSKPKANGGSNHLNNLFPACISCNRSKGMTPTNVVRNRNGVTRAPLSKVRKKQITRENVVSGGAIGMAIGLIAMGGPIGLLLGGVTGGVIGRSINPESDP